MTFSPEDSLALLAILAAVALLLIAAERTSIPYPILLVVGGLMLGFTPGVPDLVLPPDLVLIGIDCAAGPRDSADPAHAALL